jgi:hypothetical protein
MEPRQAFGVAVRVIGLLVSCAALLYFLSAIVQFFVPHYRSDAAPAWHYLLTGLVALALGAYLLRGARHVVRFAYPDHGPGA